LTARLKKEHLRITWEELFSAKPNVEQASGFGSTLIKTIVEMPLRGSLTHNLRRDGLSVVINLPQSAVSARST
jgi:two-component sensor histidine kinase